MTQALVRKSRLHCHSGWKFTHTWLHLLPKLFHFMSNITHLNIIFPRVPFDNKVNKIIAEYLWLWPITDVFPLDLHWTKETHALFVKIFYLPLTNIHSKNLLLVIQYNDNNAFNPFQPLIIDLVNHIKLYHVLHPMKPLVFYHYIKVRHIIYHCIHFRSKLVIIEFLQNNGIEKWCKLHIKEVRQSCATFTCSNMFIITSTT